MKHKGWQLTIPDGRASIAPDCISKFNELKLNKKIKYILYKLTDDYKQIVVEETSEDSDWEAFREKLLNAKSKNKAVWYPYSTSLIAVADTWTGKGGQGSEIRCL